MSNLEYLEEERKKLWARITELGNQIDELKKTTPEYEKEARNASKKISEYKNRVNNSWSEIEKHKERFLKLLQEANKITTAATTADTIDALLAKTQKVLEQANLEQKNLSSQIQNLNTQSINLSTLQEQANVTLNNATSIESKLKGLLQNSAEKKQEIEDVYDEIEGYDTEDNTHVEGLKEKLQNSFEKIEKENQNLKKDFENTRNHIFQWKTNFIKEKNSDFDVVLEKIKGLLPGAMSAGLSASYAEKRKAEEQERAQAQRSFTSAIRWMVILALIPVGVYLNLYLGNKGIEYILNHTPQITMAVLPLYLPLIWLAIHFNKRINLSKKLIEEYAYKEALNRTYEGLAGQIQNLKDKDNELRKEHLQIILKASAENPGKYITGYDKCDNPLLELISKPEKLSQLLKDHPLLTTLAEQIIKTNEYNKKEKEEHGQE